MMDGGYTTTVVETHRIVHAIGWLLLHVIYMINLTLKNSLKKLFVLILDKERCIKETKGSFQFRTPKLCSVA